MGSGMQQTTLVARRSVVSPSNGSPKSDQLGLGGKKNRKKNGCTGLLTEPLGLAWLSTEMLHLLCILRAFTCIYEPECRMRAECT